MAWPETSLVGEVCLELAADPATDPTTFTFATDITAYTFDRSGDSSIVIRRGRQDEQSVSQPSACGLELDNSDGRFSARNPVGAYYPGLKRNTPLRVRVNPGTGLTTRYVGFVSEWPPRWDVREKDHNVPVRADGVLRRLSQGATPLKSAMFRRVRSPDEPTPAAYWPCEDGSGATSVASGLPGGTPMVGTPVFGSAFGGASGSLDIFAAGDEAVFGSVTLASASGFQLECMAQCPTAGVGGTFLFEVVCGTYDDNTVLVTALVDGLPHHIATQFVQNGANVDRTNYRDGVLVSTSSQAGVLDTSLRLFTRATDADTLVAHVAVYDFASMNAPTTRAPAVTAYAGELTGDRFARLCTEEGIAATTSGSFTEGMGAQTTETLLELLRECETAEIGVIFEGADGRLTFQARAARQNIAAGLGLNYASGHVSPPFEPTDDDQLIRNDVTVTRTGGSKSQFVDTTGPVGVTAVGRYDEGVDANLLADDQTHTHAEWRVHMGTVDEMRFPTVTVNLRRNNSLTASVLLLDIGSRITISNLPDVVSFDDVDLIVEGYTEQISQKNWIITFNCAPYSPYKVGIVTDPAATVDTPRLGSGTAVLASSITTTGTSLSVTTGTGGLWTTAGADFSMDINVEGERIRLSGISGGSSPQTFTASARSQNGVVKAPNAGARVEVWEEPTLGM